LPEPFYRQVEDLWERLDALYSLRGIRVTPYPHFSWQIAEDYDFTRLEPALRAIATTAEPFRVFTTGLGIFSGPRPVIYIPLVKTSALMSFHTMVWELCQPAGRNASPFYHPQSWIPHISLAYSDVHEQNIAAVMQDLAFQSFNWDLRVDNIALIYESDGTTGTLRYNFPFEG
jgi:2'-5' RNA ligase